MNRILINDHPDVEVQWWYGVYKDAELKKDFKFAIKEEKDSFPKFKISWLTEHNYDKKTINSIEHEIIKCVQNK